MGQRTKLTLSKKPVSDGAAYTQPFGPIRTGFGSDFKLGVNQHLTTNRVFTLFFVLKVG